MNKNSLAAYRKIGKFLEGHNLEIYETLLACGAQTAWDINRGGYIDLTEAQVFRRMRDLERNGFVERLDWVKDSPSGRACSVWWVKS